MMEFISLSRSAPVRLTPLRALKVQNWLASCGGLYRSRSVSIEYFDEEATYFEWTLLAYKLASKLKMAFVDVPAYRD
jgi:hypothetical protein